MPILSASIKHARQSEERRARRQSWKTAMKTNIRKVQDLMKAGKKDEAAKVLAAAYKSIDTAAKKHIIHRRNADKKKSALAKSVGARAK